jgi:hypothetical protein
MSSSLFDYLTVNFDVAKNGGILQYASVAYPPRLPLVESLRKTYIESNEIYRPDKVAYRLYGNPMLSWIIDDANSFYSFSDYTINKEIYYPSLEALELMGIDISYDSFEEQNFG